MLEVTQDPATKTVTGVAGPPLTPGVDFTVSVTDDVGAGGQMLEIMPLKPLNPKSGYLIIVSDRVTNEAGTPAVADEIYEQIKQAYLAGFIQLPPSGTDLPPLTPEEQLGIFIAAHLAVVEGLVDAGVPISVEGTVVTASFSTVSVTDALDYVNDTATAQFNQFQQIIAPVDIPLPGEGILPAGTPITSGVVLGLLGASSQCDASLDFPVPGCGLLYAGGMNLPYYLEVPTNQNDPIAVTSIWEGTLGANLLDPESTNLSRFNPVPQKKADVFVPVLMSVPSPNSQYAQAGGTKPATGWPTMLYYPGVTRNRLDLNAVTELWNNAGYAVIAIDNPFHGITATDPAEDPTALFRVPGTTERTFDLDLVQNDDPAVGEPDGLIDPSGVHFLNPAPDRILASSDKERQAIADIIHLIRTIPTIDFDSDGSPDLDGSRINMVGDSLGGWAAIAVAVVNDDLASVTSVYPASSISLALFESESFRPLAEGITAALAAGGILPGTTTYENYFRDFQNLIEAGDPINYGLAWSKDQRIPIHIMMVDGDLTAPNESTRRLQNAMGIPQVPLAQPPVFPFPILVGSTDPVQGTNGVNGGLVFMTQGGHGSFLSPAIGGPEVTIEMQIETLVFGAGNPPAMLPGDGQIILISDPSVLDTDGQ
jgi:pimeloyl-ACP methyl ester carboxylesterase